MLKTTTSKHQDQDRDTNPQVEAPSYFRWKLRNHSFSHFVITHSRHLRRRHCNSRLKIWRHLANVNKTITKNFNMETPLKENHRPNASSCRQIVGDRSQTLVRCCSGGQMSRDRDEETRWWRHQHRSWLARKWDHCLNRIESRCAAFACVENYHRIYSAVVY